MSPADIIRIKRDGGALNRAQIDAFASGLANGHGGAIWADSQVGAMAMAVWLRGMDTAETVALTAAMTASGDILQWVDAGLHGPVVDKHSTGGVGDKVSLPLAPLLSCLGFRVPMISGRGLGITGGTLDKLDSIPGFKTLLPAKRITEIVQQVGCVICGQTETMAQGAARQHCRRLHPRPAADPCA